MSATSTKKILIVNNNLEIGGIQKSLVNLLNGVSDYYDVTLLLFSVSGKLLPLIPKNVTIIRPNKKYSVYGLNKKQIKKHPALFIFKAFLVFLRAFFPARFIRAIIGFGQKKITGFDAVISFTHLFPPKSLNAGCAEFVIEKTISNNKICFLHCDYKLSGTKCDENNRLYEKFDKIICCSDSVKNVFVDCVPELKTKAYSLRNFYDLEISGRSNLFDPRFSQTAINIVMVARLSNEKGHREAINALIQSERKDICLYFVGDGPMRDCLVQLALDSHRPEQIFFVGETDNPYPYIKKCDYLLVASKHEAAPMVFDEAIFLGKKIISSNTISAKEMIGSEGIIYNSFDELCHVFQFLKKPDPEMLQICSNDERIKKFNSILFES